MVKWLKITVFSSIVSILNDGIDAGTAENQNKNQENSSADSER